MTLGRRSRYAIPDVLGESAVRTIIQHALAGNPDAVAAADANRSRTVVWDDFGDQVLVHLDSAQVRLVKSLAFVSVDFECEQTGRAPLIVTFAMGGVQDAAGLVATTDDVPRGHPLLAGRWGRTYQETVWAALIGTARQHASERGQVPQSIHVLDGHLRLAAVAPLALGATALKSFDAAFPGKRNGAPQ
ncbi:hypothetical protein [Burkholderia sp. GbtcB21]|uniref:hypothetical protein n=1 Tax=Burkholderia sp. GbtcB21 TaxID=2824766 RepID=UPI001C2F8F79|nr:hypothetical protein [Burkholderia sp. GbtcB21]